MSSSARTTILAVIALSVTLFTGIFIGVAGTHVLIHHGWIKPSSRSATFIVKRLDRRLDLSPQQEAEIVRIVKLRHANIANVWSNVHPQVRREIELANADIEKVLTPEQRVKFAPIKMRMLRGNPRRIRFDHD